MLSSFLQALARAAAARAQKRNVIPDAATAPVINRVAPVTGLRRDKSLQAIYDAAGGDEDRVVEAFLALSPQEQFLAIEAEMAKLADGEKLVIYDLLRAQLDKKWLPLPGPQTAALNCEADILLYGGAAGGGKTDLVIGLAMTEHRRSLIMRRQYDDLSFITKRACELNGTRRGFRGSPHPTLETDDGRLIEFRAAQHEGNEQSRQGQPFDLLAFDEAAQFHESQIRFLFGWLRSADPDQRKRIVLASNPPLSDEGFWLIKMFRPWLDMDYPEPAKPGELRWFLTDENGEEIEVDGPGPHQVGRHLVRAQSRTFIPSRLSDNVYLTKNDDYETQLNNLQEPLRSALRDGNFMAARQDDAWQVIPSDWIRKAQSRWTENPPTGQPMTCVALDPAGGGKDAAAISARYGSWFAPVETIRGKETADGRFVGASLLMRRRNDCQVVIDVNGGFGAEETGVMRDNGAPVVGFRGSDASTGKSIGSGLAFANMRAEVWWRFREALDPRNGEKIALPPDQELAADLATPRLSARAMQVRGVIQVESKEEIRDRLGRSPDKGDAVTMCWAYGGLLEMERQEGFQRKAFANVGHVTSKTRSSSYGRSGRPAFANVGHGSSKRR